MYWWKWILKRWNPNGQKKEFERLYLARLKEGSQYLELRGIGLRPEDYLSTPLRLDQVYISLQFSRRKRDTPAEPEALRWVGGPDARARGSAFAPSLNGSELGLRQNEVELGRSRSEVELGRSRGEGEPWRGLDDGELEQANSRISVQQLLKQVHNRRLVILGTPGSGKTTLLRWLVLQCAKGQARALGLPGDVFPVLLLAREIARSGLPALTPYDLGKLASSPTLLAQFGEGSIGQMLKDKLKAGKCLVLVDGLDELPSDSQRQMFARQIEILAKTYPQNWFVVTSRPAGYASLSVPGFAVVEVGEMQRANIEEFCTNWYTALELAHLGSGNKQQALNRAQKRATDLTTAIQQHPQARALTTNPLLLTILALIFRNWQSLPRRRAELYDRASQILLGSWFKELKGATTISEKQQILAWVAYQMHSRQTRIIRTVELESHLSNALAEAGGNPHEAPLFLKAVQEHSGLLVELGPDLWGFSHFTFQEYLAALYLSQHPTGQATALEQRHHPWWRETILLYSGLEDSHTPLIEELLRSDNLFHSHLLLAAQCLAETGASNQYQQVLERLLQDIKQPSFYGLRQVGFAGMVAVAGGNFQEQVLQTLLGLLQDPNPQVQVGAIEALGRVGLDHTDVLVQLLRRTRDGEALLRGSAVRALGQIATNQTSISPAVTQNLLELTHDSNPSVRLSALLALGQFGFVAASLLPGLLPHLTDPDPTLRSGLAYTLGQLALAQPPLLKRLIALSNNPDPLVASTATEALGHSDSGDLAVVKHLMACTTKPQPALSGNAMVALGRLGRHNPEVVRHLFELLDSNKASTRASAAQAIGLLGTDNPTLIRRLVELIPDSDPDVRRGVAQALGKLGPVSGNVMEKLGQRVLHSSVFVSTCAAEALSCLEVARPIQNPTVIARLIELSQQPDSAIRATAATALARVGTPQDRIVERLIRLCNDPEPLVRLATLKAIGQTGWPHLDLLHHLMGLLTDPNPAVGLAAGKALEQIAETSHELSPDTFLHTQTWLQDQRPLFPGSSAPERICDWAWKLLLSHVWATGRLGNFPDGWFAPPIQQNRTSHEDQP
jgi:HEAT repeat protein